MIGPAQLVIDIHTQESTLGYPFLIIASEVYVCEGDGKRSSVN